MSLGDEDFIVHEEPVEQERPTKSYPKRKLLPQFDDEALEPVLPRYNAADRPPHGRDKGHLEPNTSPNYLTEQTEIQQFGDIHMTYGATWKTEQVRQDQSMDHGACPDARRWPSG